MKLMRRPKPVQRRFLQQTEGMSAVELALILPVMLWIVCGIIDFGNVYLHWNIASEVAREGARKAAITIGTTEAQIQSFVQTSSFDGQLKGGGSTYSVAMSPATSASGGTVTVTVTNTVALLNPIMKQFFQHQSTISVQGKTMMQVEN